MNKSAGKLAKDWKKINFVLWALMGLYAAARVLQVFPDKVPILVIVALHVFPPLIFALIHGAMSYRLRGMVVFVVLFLVVGNAIENLGVLTGFPFGRYYFTDVMGPKLFLVPVLLGFAYLGMGYLSWTLGRLILGGTRSSLAGWRIVVLPMLASFIMVAWDLSMDPIWSTIGHCWIWLDGGVYFGVPALNFFGWYLTVYVFYQLFAVYLQARSDDSGPLPIGYWHLAILFYGVSAAGNLLLAIPQRRLVSVVSDPTGTQWNVSSIAQVCALVSIFTMGAFAVLAWVRLSYHDGEAPRRAPIQG
jgi:putative membrane protein